MKEFDHNGAGIAGQLFGLPVSPQEAELVILPVPWEVTVTYQTGTAQAPTSLLQASRQIDLYHPQFPEAWKLAVSMEPVSQDFLNENHSLHALAQSYRQVRDTQPEADTMIPIKINEACENLNIYLKTKSTQYLKAGKVVGVLGGDHSTPFGLLRALADKYDRFGILQIDAHADLRKAYEGFTYSHASIMFNALRLPAVARLVQVGVRDYCEEEVTVMKRAMGRVKTFFDHDFQTSFLEGVTWKSWCDKIVNELPPLVYISFDIDGMNPTLCPNTGTPVPGGLQFHQATYLIKQVVKSGRTIIGFDLCEVGHAEWDANVGARMLWELCHHTMASRKQR